MTKMQKIHYILGYAGLIPFIGLSLLTIMNDSVSHFALITYTALIASFLGGTLWMISANEDLPMHVAITSNVIMLLSWLLIIFYKVDGIYYLASALFISLICYERRFVKHLYSPEYLQLRTWLSWIVAGCLISVAVFLQVLS